MQLKIKQTLQTAALLVLSLLVTTTAFSQTAGVIGVKFGFTGGYSSTINLGPTDQAGVVAVTNWNNLLANVLAPQGNPERAAAINVTWNIPQDSAGNALSGVTLTPDGFNDGWNSGGTACANGRLLFNCWKFNAGNGLIDGGGRSYAEFTIANLPGSAYDLHVYINDNNGNYWGNIQANSVIAIGSDIDSDGFNGASSDPCSLGTPLHTAAGFGNAANYVKLPAVATTSGGVITVTVVMLGGGDFGVSGVELVPAADLVLKRDTLPNYAETVVGDQVVFSAAFSNSPAVNLQWQDVNGGVTNYINTGVVNVTNNGVVTSTLTLNNVQLTNSGSYRLKAINTTNSSDIAYSSDAPLVVGNSPAPVNNIIVNYSGQTGGNFYPAWTINTNIDLIYGFVNGSPQTPGQFVPGAGNYGLGQTYGDPTILSDGGLGDIKSALVSCGPGDSAGQSMTYTLDTSSATSGFDLTNITVYGGWTDGGRDEQKYQVLYSTVVDPANFVPLSLVDYNPTDPSGASCATRTTLIPATGALAYNVYAVQFNFNTAVWPKNGWEGYSEISINGTPSTGIRPTLTLDIRPLTAEDVVGSTLNLTASFTGAVGVQWQKNGTNIPGATSQTLILNNLQLTDTATNGGYRLVASNAAGTTTTRGCAVIVDPAPAAAKNVVTAYAFQSSDQRSFSPTWDTSALTSSLIYGTTPSDSGIGDFTGAFDAVIAGGPSVLTDGTFGT
ncbi:MAG: Immunoglobulin subtype, partial [Pedosphaera sp.]|nr:Immunoglobulin subtype [Pedosphaera sp.]